MKGSGSQVSPCTVFTVTTEEATPTAAKQVRLLHQSHLHSKFSTGRGGRTRPSCCTQLLRSRNPPKSSGEWLYFYIPSVEFNEFLLSRLQSLHQPKTLIILHSTSILYSYTDNVSKIYNLLTTDLNICTLLHCGTGEKTLRRISASFWHHSLHL